MRSVYVWITAALAVVCLGAGVGVGYGLWGTRPEPAELDRIRAVADRAEAELAASRRALREARDANHELAVTNTELRDRVAAAADYNRELADRNRRITDALGAAERDLELAVGETTELTELLNRIIGIVDDLFSGNRDDYIVP